MYIGGKNSILPDLSPFPVQSSSVLFFPLLSSSFLRSLPFLPSFLFPLSSSLFPLPSSHPTPIFHYVSFFYPVSSLFSRVQPCPIFQPCFVVLFCCLVCSAFSSLVLSSVSIFFLSPLPSLSFSAFLCLSLLFHGLPQPPRLRSSVSLHTHKMNLRRGGANRGRRIAKTKQLSLYTIWSQPRLRPIN